MVRIRDGDQEVGEKNLRIPLYKAELKQLKPGEMNWLLLNQDIKVLGAYLGKFGTVNSSLWIGKMEAIHDRIDRWIQGYLDNNTYRIAVLGFEYHWTLLRTWIPLQVRLAVEQVLSDRGGDFGTLVSGFRPISRRKSLL